MRAGLVVVVVSFVVGLGQAASADTMPDLPGMGVAESVTGGAAAPTEDATSVEINTTSDDRMPAPDPTEASADASAAEVSEAVDATVSPQDSAIVAELPGGTAIPLISDVAAVSNSGTGIALLAALALAVAVLWTRFLIRLNDVR